MGSINFHPWVQNVTGRYGRVFTRRHPSGKIITVMPRSTPPSTSPTQAAFQARFKETAAYAARVLEHPTRRTPYEEQARESHKPAFALVMGEFLRNPLLRLVNTSAYHGQVGNPIDIRGRDDLIASVDVVLRGEGEAELDFGDTTVVGGAWRFTAAATIPAGTALTVEVRVTDTSGIELVRRLPLVVG